MKWNNVKEENEMLKEKASTSVVGVRSEIAKGKGKGRDMQGGLDLLDTDFLLSIVDNTDSSQANDVTMRKINFNELLRRNQRHEISSSALKVYTMDVDGVYGKDIQCQAMQELAERTSAQA